MPFLSPFDPGRRPGPSVASSYRMKERLDDQYIVVLVDGIHVPVSRVSSRLRVELSRMGSSSSEIHPATASCAGELHRCCRGHSPPGLGTGGRLHLGRASDRQWLGSCRSIVALSRPPCRSF